MPAEELIDLKIVRTGQEYRGLPRTLVRQWVRERRVIGEDLVRPVGSARWMKVALAPELAEEPPPIAPDPPAPVPETQPRPERFRTPDSRAAEPRPAETRPAETRPAETRPSSLGGSVQATVAGGNPFGILAPAKARRRRPKREVEDTSLDMTPMIDVTFQLLIFFMLTNTMAHPTPIKVPVAEYGRGVSPDGMQTIVVSERGDYYLGDSTREEARAANLEALVAEVARNASQVDQPLDVIVSAHQQARHGMVRDLMERLGTVANIGVVRIGVEEKR